MSPDVAAAIAATGVAKVTPVEPPTRWLIEPDSRVGIVSGDDWELRIRPRLAVPKLLFLLAYSLQPDGWKNAVANMEAEDDVVEALASGFASHGERALERGILHGYLTVEERRYSLRGRVRFADQLARHHGSVLPLEVAYDDFTADIPENRILRTAIERLLLFSRIQGQRRARLMRLHALLDEAATLPARAAVAIPHKTRLNERYEAALVLGKLILDGTSLRQDHGPVAATTFLFDMNEVFESFIFTALKEALRRFGGIVERQTLGALDTATPARLTLRADITWRKNGVLRAVIDSKYKRLESADAMPNADAYQMLAYCVGFNVQRGFLIYARDELTTPRTHIVKRHGYEIDVRAVDVERDPEDLLAQVDDIAHGIAASADLAKVAIGAA